LKIKIFYDEIAYRLRNSKSYLTKIEEVIRSERLHPGDLSFIITTDKNLIGINKEFLNHNYFTDVIAFAYNEGKILKGEIYISLETVRKNAANYKVSLKKELLRVMIHGTLHLCGYDDKTEREKELMREKEDFWLNLFERKQ
jgi:probable rRNA maturation factor